MDKNKKLFPQKLWELIHNPSIQHCLRWSQDGQRVYLNRNEFEAYYLKTPNNQFHTQKAISFVRQMNMYGFRKVDDCYYENDNFRRDQQHLLRNMIRRHPNKGLFVGLDHHQLAAAAAAQQALHVNKQLQQLEHQHHLNNSSSSFVRMSSQLAQAAANNLSQQQPQLGNHLSLSNNINPMLTNDNDFSHTSSSPGAVHIQPKKSRFRNNFCATATGANGNPINATRNRNSHCADNNQLAQMHNQGSMHSTSSVDTKPSQCSSVVNSGSAGLLRPNSPTVLRHRLASLKNLRQSHHHHNNHHQSSSSSSAAAAASRAALSDSSSSQAIGQKFDSSNNNNGIANIFGQQAATDLSKQSLATRQAFHQTLVRSLLQLEQNQQHPQDLLASLQQQNPRALLESLASLSSVGTGSIVDPTSTPTERTGIPPSSPPSPETGSARDQADYVNNFASLDNIDNNNIVLDLAKSSATNFGKLAKRQLASIRLDNNPLLNLLAEHSKTLASNTSPRLADDQGDLNDDYCAIGFEEDLFKRNCSLIGHSSSSSSSNQELTRVQHDFDDSDNVVLNLAKSSNTRPDDKHKISRRSN